MCKKRQLFAITLIILTVNFHFNAIRIRRCKLSITIVVDGGKMKKKIINNDLCLLFQENGFFNFILLFVNNSALDIFFCIQFPIESISNGIKTTFTSIYMLHVIYFSFYRKIYISICHVVAIQMQIVAWMCNVNEERFERRFKCIKNVRASALFVFLPS